MAEPLSPDDAAARALQSPVPALPALLQLILPTPWEVGPVQIYLLEGRPLTLIDTGVKSAASREALDVALATRGHRVADVERIVLTHYHGDHLGQTQSIRDRGAIAQVLCHEAEVTMVEGFTAERDENIEATNELFREHGVPADVIDRQTEMRRRWIAEDPPLSEATRVDTRLRDGDRIECDGFALHVVHAPGHTAGHLLLHEPRSGVLLTGDHLMGDAVPFTDTYFVSDTPDPCDPLGRRRRFRGLPAYLASLERLARLPLRVILPAHGGIVREPIRAIEDARLFYEVRVQRVERAIEKLGAGDAVTAWSVWRQLFPRSDPVTQMRTRMLMVIGAIDVLADAGRVRTERADDQTLRHRSV